MEEDWEGIEGLLSQSVLMSTHWGSSLVIVVKDREYGRPEMESRDDIRSEPPLA